MQRTPVLLELGGRRRRLSLDLNALAAFEEKTGHGLEGMRAATMKIATLRMMLWACLLSDDPTTTIDQVGSWIDLDNLAEVTQALSTVLSRSMPRPKDGEETGRPTQAA